MTKAEFPENVVTQKVVFCFSTVKWNDWPLLVTEKLFSSRLPDIWEKKTYSAYFYPMLFYIILYKGVLL